jgi:hypothetical protein
LLYLSVSISRVVFGRAVECLCTVCSRSRVLKKEESASPRALCYYLADQSNRSLLLEQEVVLAAKVSDATGAL